MLDKSWFFFLLHPDPIFGQNEWGREQEWERKGERERKFQGLVFPTASWSHFWPKWMRLRARESSEGCQFVWYASQLVPLLAAVHLVLLVLLKSSAELWGILYWWDSCICDPIYIVDSCVPSWGWLGEQHSCHGVYVITHNFPERSFPSSVVISSDHQGNLHFLFDYWLQVTIFVLNQVYILVYVSNFLENVQNETCWSRQPVSHNCLLPSQSSANIYVITPGPHPRPSSPLPPTHPPLPLRPVIICLYFAGLDEMLAFDETLWLGYCSEKKGLVNMQHASKCFVNVCVMLKPYMLGITKCICNMYMWCEHPLLHICSQLLFWYSTCSLSHTCCFFM